jgi:hypothetical protein
MQASPEYVLTNALRTGAGAPQTLVERNRLGVMFSRDRTRVWFSFMSPGRMCQIEVPMVRIIPPGAPPRDFGPWAS